VQEYSSVFSERIIDRELSVHYAEDAFHPLPCLHTAFRTSKPLLYLILYVGSMLGPQHPGALMPIKDGHKDFVQRMSHKM
jgi:hypothetical protein